MRGTKRPPQDTSPQSVNRAAPPDVQDETPSQKRVKRADYARRLAERKTLDIYSRKTTLHTFCKEEARHLEFDECIISVNHAVAEAYMLANYYVIQELQDRADGATLCLINQDFYQQCLAKVTANTHLKNPKTPALVKAGDAFNELRGNRARADTKYLNQGWFQPAALQMATNANNAVCLNFGRRLREFVIAKFDLSRVNAKEAMDRIFAVSTEGFTLTFGRLADPAVAELYPKIPRTTEGGVNWRPHLLMPLLYEMLCYFEESNIEIERDNLVIMAATTATNSKKKRKLKKKHKLFSLLPLKQGYRASYCTVNSTGLKSLLQRSPGVPRDLAIEHNDQIWRLGDSLARDAPWSELADKWWRRLFHVDRLEKGERGGEFHHEMSTDGYGVTAHLSRPTRGDKSARKKRSDGKRNKSKVKELHDAFGASLSRIPKGSTDDYDVVWGIDPGVTDFITAVNQDGDKLRFRTTDFRRASGMSRSNRKIRQRINRDPIARQLLNEAKGITKKTASMATFKGALEFWFAHGRVLLEFFMKPAYFRNLKFRRFTLRNAQLDRACYELAGAPETRTIVGFGDCGTAGQGVVKGCVRGPVKEFATRLSRHCEVVVIDEYRTSQIHCGCRSIKPLENQRELRYCRDGVVRKVPVHKVLHCLTKNGGCGRTVDRDVNAAANIRSILQNQLARIPDRPLRLQRPLRAPGSEVTAAADILGRLQNQGSGAREPARHTWRSRATVA